MRSTLCLSRTGLWPSLSHSTISWHSGIRLPDLNLSASSLEIWVRVHQYQCIFKLLVHASLTVGKESGVILHPSSVTKPFTGIFRVISSRPNLILMVASCVAKRPKYSLITCNRKWSLHQSITLLGMWVMYRILYVKILRDDKVVSPVIRLLHSVVQMCTVGSWSPLSPCDSKPREVTQLDATIGTVCSKHSSIHWPEIVRKFLLRAFGRDKGQCCIIFLKCTMLYFQCHWFCKLAGCWNPEDRTEEIWILRKLKLHAQKDSLWCWSCTFPCQLEGCLREHEASVHAPSTQTNLLQLELWTLSLLPLLLHKCSLRNAVYHFN